ncbi:MAG: UDP-N-acetylmuramoylalanyl-D-glutamyl-2, 6-diaminopimelate--D-alanyl-D-alanine ligase [Hyphomicrobiales bacterium]|nr:MAG: UDP-N-acetylmuramoylalanyl-D-glutamyl-2, 6-diaminopimelate--D-alanyl-D-alanine ligase [Hyphomicrobiales bacterium]
MNNQLWLVSDLLEITGGKLSGNHASQIFGFSIDSRTLQSGDCYFAIRGDRLDGHHFVENAFQNGASLAIVEESWKSSSVLDLDCNVLSVPDVVHAMENIGIAARNRVPDNGVVAVTGSVGKTTTKDMLNMALSACGPTHASVSSFNNHWGVPLTLARMARDTEFGVFEIGMNHPGEIAPLVKMVRPSIVIITGVEAVHIEYFEDTEQIAEAKSEIFTGVVHSGTAILNRDNSWYSYLFSKATNAGIDRIISFGSHSDADVRLLDVRIVDDRTDVVARVFGKNISYSIGAPGYHFAQNSLAVLAVCHVLNVDLVRAVSAFPELRARRGRGARELLKLDGGTAVLIDESYNANPVSMRAALATLALLKNSLNGRKIIVLGDMLELGQQAKEQHEDLIEAIETADVDRVYLCGPMMEHLWHNIPQNLRGSYSNNSAGLVDVIAETLLAEDVIMIKGSLGSNMKPIVDRLKQLPQELEIL